MKLHNMGKKERSWPFSFKMIDDYLSWMFSTVHSFISPEIQHLFYSKENDWGYSNFLPWNVSLKIPIISLSVSNKSWAIVIARLLKSFCKNFNVAHFPKKY